MGVDGALVTLEVVAEHLLNQLHARIYATGITRKRGEQLELACRQVYLLAGDHDLVPRHVNGQLAELQHLALRLAIGMHAAQKGAGAGYQLARAERLHQVVVGAKLKADDAIFHFALCRKHDNGHIGIVANGAAYALARNAREHKIENNQIEMVLGELFQRFLTVAHGGYPVVLTL